MIQNKTYTFKGAGDRLISADLTYANMQESAPICLFLHGFKGFKDLGAWPLAAEIFASKKIPFFKINFSHNGTTPKQNSDFVDLEAFGNNNLMKEMEDVQCALNFIENKAESFDFTWNGEIYLIGHSRGGGIAVLTAAQDERITKLATWASVSDFKKHVFLKDESTWKKEGVAIIKNGRTGQDMPVYYQFLTNFMAHLSELHIDDNAGNITCPTLILHGEKDESVSPSNAKELFSAIAHSIEVEIEGANHTFNTAHPLTERKISKAFAEVITESIAFFQL